MGEKSKHRKAGQRFYPGLKRTAKRANGFGGRGERTQAQLLLRSTQRASPGAAPGEGVPAGPRGVVSTSAPASHPGTRCYLSKAAFSQRGAMNPSCGHSTTTKARPGSGGVQISSGKICRINGVGMRSQSSHSSANTPNDLLVHG